MLVAQGLKEADPNDSERLPEGVIRAILRGTPVSLSDEEMDIVIELLGAHMEQVGFSS